jgi:hypothetical protein
MTSIISPLPLKAYRILSSVIAYAVGAYHRFVISLREVEDFSRREVGRSATRRSLRGQIVRGSVTAQA